MKVAIGFVLCMLLVCAFGYGWEVAMTVEGFAVQGLIGASIPVLFVLLGVAMGAMLVWHAGEAS